MKSEDVKAMLELVSMGGWLVSSARCDVREITWARAENRMFVDDNGLGFIVRPAASFPERTSLSNSEKQETK